MENLKSSVQSQYSYWANWPISSVFQLKFSEQKISKCIRNCRIFLKYFFFSILPHHAIWPNHIFTERIKSLDHQIKDCQVEVNSPRRANHPMRNAYSGHSICHRIVWIKPPLHKSLNLQHFAFLTTNPESH